MELDRKEVKSVGESRYLRKKRWAFAVALAVGLVGFMLVAIAGDFTGKPDIALEEYQLANHETTMLMSVERGDVILDDQLWLLTTEADTGFTVVMGLGLLMMFGALVVLIVSIFEADKAGNKLVEVEMFGDAINNPPKDKVAIVVLGKKKPEKDKT